MTTPSDSVTRAALIKKLLNKAEARGTTEAEREAFNAKATALMIQWGVDEALVQDADRAKIENIVQRHYETDVPKVYSFEYALIGVEVANQLGCRGLLQRMANGRTNLLVVGFESDVERVRQLYVSLILQCRLTTASWYAERLQPWWNGTDKFNAKRSCIRGFADGVRTRLADIKRGVIADATPGTELVLVDRKSRIDRFVADEMNTGVTRKRTYMPSGFDAGRHAGLRADVGGAKLGNDRRAVER